MEKRIILVFTSLIFLLVGLHAQSSKQWNTSYEAAQDRAKINHKPIMLFFSGSDWCRPCILLKTKILETPQLSQWMDDHVNLVWCDFPRAKKNMPPAEIVKQNESLAASYNKKGEFPTIVFMDADGAVIARTGYHEMTPETYIAHLNGLLKK